MAYEEPLTEKLLALAMALRTKFYQGIEPKGTEKYATDAGLLYCLNGDDEVGPESFTFKDVRDKIIHSERFEMLLTNVDSAKLTDFFGSERRGRKSVAWRLGISIPCYAAFHAQQCRQNILTMTITGGVEWDA